MLNYYSYTCPYVDGLSQFECVLGHKGEICHSLEFTSEVVATGIFKAYHSKLKKNDLS